MGCVNIVLQVVGGGSGGLASARRAALLGARVGLVESNHLGGTCVNLGCVPKKVMYNAANIRQELVHDARDYGVEVEGEVVMNWGKLVDRRDAYVKRLNNIYEKHLDNAGVEVIRGWGRFVGEKQVGF